MTSHARLLIVDDNPHNVLLLKRILQVAGYNPDRITGLPNGAQALQWMRTNTPDIMLLDLNMNGMDGYEVLRRLPEIVPVDAFMPVLVITADATVRAREQALALGATDYLLRPHETFDVVLRVRNLLQTRFLHLELLARNEDLENQVRERTQHLEESQAELRLAQLDVIDRLALVGEHHDDETAAHTQRVARTCRHLAQCLGLDPDEVELLRRAAPLHDVGKIGVSDTILQKPGKLTPEEFDTMKKHCELGAQLLSDGRSEMMKVARTVAISHHERFDGTGYPNGLKGDDIPIEGRILAVADVFDALTHDRPYKKAWPIEAAVAEIKSQAARQFDPEIVEAFCMLDHEKLVDGADGP